MTDTNLIDAVVFPQDDGTGVPDGQESFDSAGSFSLLSRYKGEGTYVGEDKAGNATLQFNDVDTSNNEFDISAGHAYILDGVTIQSGAQTTYDTNLPEDTPYVVVVPNEVTNLSLDSGTNDVWLSVDPTANDSVTVRHGSGLSAPSDPSIKLGTVDASLGDTTRANDLANITASSVTTTSANIDRELEHTVVINERWGDDLGNLINMAMDYVDTEVDGITAGADDNNPTNICVAPRSNNEAWEWGTQANIDQNSNVRLLGLGYADVTFTADLSPALLVGATTKMNKFEMGFFSFDIAGQSMGDIIAHAAGTKCYYHDMDHGDTGSGSADSLWAHDPSLVTGSEFGVSGTVLERMHFTGAGAAAASTTIDTRESSGERAGFLTIRDCRVDGTTAGIRTDDPRECTISNIQDAAESDTPTLKVVTSGNDAVGNVAENIRGASDADTVDIDATNSTTRGNVWGPIQKGTSTPSGYANVDGISQDQIVVRSGNVSLTFNPYITIGSNCTDVAVYATPGGGDLDGFVSDNGTRTTINNQATESANAETPQVTGYANLPVMVDFTDTGDGSGDGLYIIDISETVHGPI